MFAILKMGLILINIGVLASVILPHLESFRPNHIFVGLPIFLINLIVQTFVMFYFINSITMIENYLRKTTSNVDGLLIQARLLKKQAVPWPMLIMILSSFAIFLGAAHDTNMVEKFVHRGVCYGWIMANLGGLFFNMKQLSKLDYLILKFKTKYSIDTLY